MNFGRLGRHLLAMPGAVRRAFPPAAMAAIEQAIARSETQHRGEVRFAVEAALDASSIVAGESARARAVEVFAQLGVWDTAENNGVLIYLLLAEHRIEIVADRGVNRHVPHSQWEAIVARMSADFAARRYEAGLAAAIDAVTALLERHFPLGAGQANPNELPDAPHLR